MSTLTIATRKSKLALIQANLIKDLLMRYHPNLDIKLLGVTTKGDVIQNQTLADIGGKALFLKELQQALLDGRADIAVHSAKDVPVEDIPGLAYVAVCQRQDPRDVLISKNNIVFKNLPKNAIVGTSSPRRSAQLLSHRPDLQIKLLRGNVDSRLQKLKAGEYDAIVLAAAGIKRLGLQEYITEVFDLNFMLPAVGQGALMIEARTTDKFSIDLVKCLHQSKVASAVHAERAFTKTLQGNCHSSIGVHAEIQKKQLILDGLVVSLDGKTKLRAKKTGPIAQAKQLGTTLAQCLLQLGADKILQQQSSC